MQGYHQSAAPLYVRFGRVVVEENRKQPIGLGAADVGRTFPLTAFAFAAHSLGDAYNLHVASVGHSIAFDASGLVRIQSYKDACLCYQDTSAADNSCLSQVACFGLGSFGHDHRSHANAFGWDCKPLFVCHNRQDRYLSVSYLHCSVIDFYS